MYIYMQHLQQSKFLSAMEIPRYHILRRKGDGELKEVLSF